MKNITLMLQDYIYYDNGEFSESAKNQYELICGIHVLASENPDKFLLLLGYVSGYLIQPKTMYSGSPSFHFSRKLIDMLGLTDENCEKLGYTNNMELLDVLTEYISETFSTSLLLRSYKDCSNSNINRFEKNTPQYMLSQPIN